MWFQLLRDFGLPTVFALGAAWILVDRFIDPMVAQQALLITSVVEENSASQKTNETLSEAVGGIDTSLQALDASVVKENQFMEKVNGDHAAQIDLLKANQDIMSDSNSIMRTAQEAMADVPQQREDQLKLLTEIRDGLAEEHVVIPTNGG